MIVFLIILGLTGLAISVALVIVGVKMIARQMNVDDCMPDWDDCL